MREREREGEYEWEFKPIIFIAVRDMDNKFPSSIADSFVAS